MGAREVSRCPYVGCDASGGYTPEKCPLILESPTDRVGGGPIESTGAVLFHHVEEETRNAWSNCRNILRLTLSSGPPAIRSLRTGFWLTSADAT